MGFFNRVSDFGDREQIKTFAMRIDTGLQQLKRETSSQMIAAISSAVKQDVDSMLLIAGKLSLESLLDLKVNYAGNKIPYFTFLTKISETSEQIIHKGGYPLI